MKTKKRTTYILITIIIFIMELIIALFLHRIKFIRGYTGDILAVMLIYFFFKSLYDFKPKLLAPGVLLISFFIEMLQYLKITEYFEITNKILKTLLGSVFDPGDLVSYTVGAVLSCIIDIMLIGKLK